MNRFDVAIVGSGAAGSVIAWQLAQRGIRVAILEKGARQDPTTFQHSEFQMMPRVYKHGGFQTTADNDLVILQACTVGGSTVVNNAIWMRADLDRILPEWAALGAPLEAASLNSAYTELEKLLKVSDLPANMANPSTKLFLDACKKQGIDARRLKNNREDCIGCGWCNYGCRYNRKTSMLVTLIPWAESKGAVVIDRCQNLRLVTKGSQIASATFVRDGKTETVKADRFVVCAGAIGSSEVLLASGVTNNGLVGRGLHVLGGVVVNGKLTENVRGYDGIGLTSVANVGPRQVIETFFSPPGAFAVTMGGWFEDHARRMQDYAHYMQAGVMVGCAPRGVVSLKGNRTTQIKLQFSAKEVEALREGIKVISRIFFAAGAQPVLPSTYQAIELRSPADFALLDKAVRRPDDLLLGSAHPQGGNPINENPKKGVIDLRFRVHGFDNLYVADASVFPTNIWANCQATVMAIAHVASTFISDGAMSTAAPAIMAGGSLKYEIRKKWKNHDGNQSALPLRQYKPEKLEDAISIVKEAETLGVTVRAIGSSHSWSDVCITTDFMVLPTGLDKPLTLDASVLKSTAQASTLVEVESGMRLRELNEFLDKRKLALPNMGGYDGQTIVGVMSTSTHGSGLDFGPLAEIIQSLDIVASEGRVYRIEPTAGITDPNVYRARYPDRNLVQDDRWFRAVLVSMGCMGVVYSVILSVVPKFWLKEVRTLTTWESLKPELGKGVVFSQNDHYELLLNPYTVDGFHSCLVTTRNKYSEIGDLLHDKRHRHFFNELISSLPFIAPLLRAYFDENPEKIPGFINRTLKALVDDAYIDKSYKVFNIGKANEIDSYSCELALPMINDTYIEAVDRMLEIAAQVAASGKVFQSGPIALRFVRGTDIFLSPQQGGNTCMVEIICVKDTAGALELMYRYEHEMYRFGGRPHWGQVNSISSYEVHRFYPHLQEWLEVHKILNAKGTFDSPFSWRVGLSRPIL
jgi:choline dehydrogenase-like flavoprotein